eukprot:364344-Chlamydomonas_euryale.AAC.7
MSKQLATHKGGGTHLQRRPCQLCAGRSAWLAGYRQAALPCPRTPSFKVELPGLSAHPRCIKALLTSACRRAGVLGNQLHIDHSTFRHVRPCNEKMYDEVAWKEAHFWYKCCRVVCPIYSGCACNFKTVNVKT